MHEQPRNQDRFHGGFLGGSLCRQQGHDSRVEEGHGNEPPSNNPDPEESVRDIVIWTAISGVVATLIKLSVTRLANRLEHKEEIETGGQAEV
jgi:hypothetical protein